MATIDPLDKLIELLSKDKHKAPVYKAPRTHVTFTMERDAYEKGWADGWDALRREILHILNS